jgi:hypothetical protein
MNTTNIENIEIGTIWCEFCNNPIFTYDVKELRNTPGTAVIKSDIVRYIKAWGSPPHGSEIICPDCSAPCVETLRKEWKKLQSIPREWDEISN